MDFGWKRRPSSNCVRDEPIATQLINGLAGLSVDSLKPLFDVVKGLLVCYVVHHNDTMRLTTIRNWKNQVFEIKSKRLISLLTAKMLQLKFERKKNCQSFFISNCSKSSFFVKKNQLWFPKKKLDLKKIVKMLRVCTF